MNFFQVFGVDVIALGVYILGMVLAWVSSPGNEDDRAALLFAIYGATEFIFMFTVWYMGIPVPAWMK